MARHWALAPRIEVRVLGGELVRFHLKELLGFLSYERLLLSFASAAPVMTTR